MLSYLIKFIFHGPLYSDDDNDDSSNPLVVKTQYGYVEGYSFSITVSDSYSYGRGGSGASYELYGWEGEDIALDTLLISTSTLTAGTAYYHNRDSVRETTDG